MSLWRTIRNIPSWEDLSLLTQKVVSMHTTASSCSCSICKNFSTLLALSKWICDWNFFRTFNISVCSTWYFSLVICKKTATTIKICEMVENAAYAYWARRPLYFSKHRSFTISNFSIFLIYCDWFIIILFSPSTLDSCTSLNRTGCFLIGARPIQGNFCDDVCTSLA